MWPVNKVVLISAVLGLASANILNSGELQSVACGYPGKPDNGVLTPENGENYTPGQSVKYRCLEKFVLFGGDSRTCRSNGTWTGSVPQCRANLALNQPSLQSATLWSYDPGLAVDDDIATCSFTPRTEEQRWWQVHLGESTSVESVSVAMSPGSFQHFTIFVIELLDGNKALYKPCSKFQGQYDTPRAVFLCNDGLGHFGQFVYLRDDREEQNYFGLCEVQVFQTMGESSCGVPERSVGSLAVTNGTTAIFSCLDGYLLEGSTVLECTEKGSWKGAPPTCTEVECEDPMSPKNGYIEVSNFKGRYQLGSKATYKCNPGFKVWGNASRLCTSSGSWSGSAPDCHPITCGQPPQVAGADVELVNRTSTWRSQAKYTCKSGYSNLFGNTSVEFSECSQEGSWGQPKLMCNFDPVSAVNSFKKGRSLGEWGEEEGKEGQLSLATVITIGVLSALLVISVLVGIAILSHRRAQAQVNSRKTSHSSNNHLILSPINPDNTKDNKNGMILYDDLNNPHMVESDHDTVLDKYCVDSSIYQKTSLTTFSSPPPPTALAKDVRILHLEGEVEDSPLSDRYSGDGGSDRDGHYAFLNEGRVVYDDEAGVYEENPYCQLRRPDGQAEEDPYASVRVQRRADTVGILPVHDVHSHSPVHSYSADSQSNSYDEKVYETLRKLSGEYSYGGLASTAGEPRAQLISPNSEAQVLYAKVDMAKKLKNRNSVGSITPTDISPTKLLISKFNSISSSSSSSSSTNIRLPNRQHLTDTRSLPQGGEGAERAVVDEHPSVLRSQALPPPPPPPTSQYVNIRVNHQNQQGQLVRPNRIPDLIPNTPHTSSIDRAGWNSANI